MNFFYLSDSTIPSQRANSVQVMHMCEAFSRLSKNVTLFCRATETPVTDFYKFYGVEASFEIQRVKLPNIRIVDRLLYAHRVLQALHRTDRPRTIYARELLVSGLACFLLPRRRNRIVLEIHSPPPSRFWRWWIGRMVASGRLSAVVTISQALAREFSTIYPKLPANRVLVAHDGAPARRQLDTAGIPSGFSQSNCCRPRVGYVGSLRPGKGMELIQRLAPLLPEVDFHVVGGEAEAIRSWKARIESQNIVFHGFIEPAKTEAYIDAFDIVLAPFQPSVLVGKGDLNISPWMSPLKIFEYMKMGKPIVASNLPVLREVLEHGSNALLAEATDPKDWAANIRQLLMDPDLRRELGENADMDFHSRYTWDKRAELIIAAIDQLPDAKLGSLK